MKPRALGAFLVIAVTVVACMSEREKADRNKALGEVFLAPINALSLQVTGGTDIAYATQAFQRRNNRWPANQTELTNFVAKSDGYLIMRDHDRIDFSTEPDNHLRIAFFPPGKTNKQTLILSTNKPPTVDRSNFPPTLPLLLNPTGTNKTNHPSN